VLGHQRFNDGVHRRFDLLLRRAAGQGVAGAEQQAQQERYTQAT
jgi:hypothetical protein